MMKTYAIGVDIGGTTVKTSIFERSVNPGFLRTRD